MEERNHNTLRKALSHIGALSLLDHAHLGGLKGDTYVSNRSRTSARASIERFFYRVGSCCKRGGGAHGKNSISLLDDV